MYRTTIATTRRDVEALRGAWQRCEIADIDADIDAFLALLDSAGERIEPYVVHIRRRERNGAERDLLAVARIERAAVPMRVGYCQLLALRMPAVVVSFGGLVGVREEADAALLIAELRRPLRAGKADMLILRNVVPGQEVHAAASRFRLSHVQQLARRWAAPVSGSLDAFLEGRSSKSRQKLRREDRQFLAEYGSRIELRVYNAPSDLDRVCQDCETIAAKTYQRGLRAGFADTPPARALMKLCLERGWHRSWVLYIDGEPTAFWAGVAYRGTFIVTALGYDPAYSRYSVGRYTMLRMVEDLCADPAITRLDLGPGDADYKMAFARETHSEAIWLLASRSPRGVALILALSFLAGVNRLGRHILEERGWKARARKIWRLRFASRREPASTHDRPLPRKVV